MGKQLILELCAKKIVPEFLSLDLWKDKCRSYIYRSHIHNVNKSTDLDKGVQPKLITTLWNHDNA